MRWFSTAVVAMWLIVPAHAAAQSTVYLLTPPPDACLGACPGRISAFDVDARAVTMTAPITPAYRLHQGGGVYATPDGRFVVWRAWMSGGERLLAVFDVTTRQTSTLRIADDPSLFVFAPQILGHPSRTEVFTADSSGAVALSSGGIRRFVCTTCEGKAHPMALSGDGTRVAYQYAAFTTTVFDTVSGAWLATLAHGFGPVTLSRDGHESYVASGHRIRRYSVPGGALLQELDLPTDSSFFGQPRMFVDPRSGEVFVVGGQMVRVLAGDPLSEVRSGFAPWARDRSVLFDFTFDRDRARAYVTSHYLDVANTPHNLTVSFDLLHLRADASIEVRDPGSFPGWFAVAPHPTAPTALAATVSDANVQLSWRQGVSPAVTTRHVLEVGSAPGLADLYAGLQINSETSFAANQVPPGRYYVRVRAGNYTGLSAPSHEIVVQVP